MFQGRYIFDLITQARFPKFSWSGLHSQFDKMLKGESVSVSGWRCGSIRELKKKELARSARLSHANYNDNRRKRGIMKQKMGAVVSRGLQVT